jgi:hypothetical protein
LFGYSTWFHWILYQGRVMGLYFIPVLNPYAR